VPCHTTGGGGAQRITRSGGEADEGGSGGEAEGEAKGGLPNRVGSRTTIGGGVAGGRDGAPGLGGGE